MRLILLLTVIVFISCNSNTGSKQSRSEIRAEIERILEIQETAYEENTPESRQRMAATCEDSLLYASDGGGLATNVNAYVHDLADGYSVKPHDRFFQIYENTVIVSSLHQSYKLLSDDTLFLNVRTTKTFVKHADGWKMALIAYAPLPVTYYKYYHGSTSMFNDYQGVYKIESAVSDTISVENGKLYSTITGSQRAELKPLNDSTFVGEGYFGKTVFARNSKGKVTHYYFEATDGQRITFPRIK